LYPAHLLLAQEEAPMCSWFRCGSGYGGAGCQQECTDDNYDERFPAHFKTTSIII
jgi:hypothetical protein